MSKNIKKKYMIIILIVIVLLIIAAGITVSFIWKIESRNRDLRFCIERKLEFELGEGVTLAEGEVYESEYGEECVNAKFEIEEQELHTLKQNLKKMGNEISELPRESDLWIDLKKQKIEKYYSCFTEGKKAKTVIANVYIAKDELGKHFLYVFY